MNELECSPNHYYKILRNYQEAQLLFAAIRLNIFSYLDVPQRVEALAEVTGCDKIQLSYMLLSLASCGFIVKQGEYYLNSSEANAFLSRNSNVFLGDTLLFRERMTSLENVEEKVKVPPSENKEVYDFAELARLTIPELYTGRVQGFMDTIGKLYPSKDAEVHVLDLGGGAGILDIEWIKQYPNSKATILETPEVSVVAKEMIRQHKMEEKIEVITGDFNADSFGGPYDFIIASGVLNFVDGELSAFMDKITHALKEDGYLFVIGQFAHDKNDAPVNMVSWLSGFLNGIPLPPHRKGIERALQNVGLSLKEQVKISMFEGQIYQKNRTTPGANSDEVIDSFIMLTEKIANSKTNVLAFGSEEMTFYRGEIHIIKTIGDYPGIHSAELARKYGITRPVVHKTLQKLSERGLIVKQEDPEDKKRYLLFLTEKGQTAYHAHEKYHGEYDKALFDFLEHTSGDKLASMKQFLEYAIGLIENHA